MAQDVAQHATGPPHKFRIMADRLQHRLPKCTAFQSRTPSGSRTLGGSPQPGDGSTSGSLPPPTRKLLSGFPQPRTLRTRGPCIDSTFDKAPQNSVCLTMVGLCCDTSHSKITIRVAESRDRSVRTPSPLVRTRCFT
ncbi:hypothetical protein PoB_000582300 [Plakobranchus ocellatus]|uniref:Uncharacterized protein n=1 Tax=Plakobranchus ocellatus TaxID=259542 RepID=A0AAV3YA25_9GAST|nr:hypothetical protein PoB_000582300 [Plakobranchus ocellatus]